MKRTKTIFGTILGLFFFFLVFFLMNRAIDALLRIPVIRAVMFFPANIPWATTILPPVVSVLIGAMISKLICKTSLPLGTVLISLVIIGLVLMFLFHQYTLQRLLVGIFTIISAALASGVKNT